MSSSFLQQYPTSRSLQSEQTISRIQRFLKEGLPLLTLCYSVSMDPQRKLYNSENCPEGCGRDFFEDRKEASHKYLPTEAKRHPLTTSSGRNQFCMKISVRQRMGEKENRKMLCETG